MVQVVPFHLRNLSNESNTTLGQELLHLVVLKIPFVKGDPSQTLPVLPLRSVGSLRQLLPQLRGTFKSIIIASLPRRLGAMLGINETVGRAVLVLLNLPITCNLLILLHIEHTLLRFLNAKLLLSRIV